MKKHRRADLEARGHVVNHVDDRTFETVKAQTHQSLDRKTGRIVERGNIARSPGINSAKGAGSVPVHANMRSRAGESMATNWRDLAPDASSPNPLDPEVPGKRLTPPQPSFGMRSRIADTEGASPGQNHSANVGRGVDRMLGRKLIAEALSSGSTALPSAPVEK